MQDLLRYVIVPIHRDGWRFIGLCVAASAVLFVLVEPLGWAGLVVTLWCVYFFRDPDRVVPTRPGLVISPADGIVVSVAEAPPPPELEMGDRPRARVGIFLTVFDVHVNRVPADGVITKLAYRPGRFINASLDKSSEVNERMAVRLEMPDGRDLAFVQIAGLVARRIVCDLRMDQTVRSGERFGLIRFGSRLDVYLPEGVNPLVVVGQRVLGGETVIADIRANEPAREGEVR